MVSGLWQFNSSSLTATQQTGQQLGEAGKLGVLLKGSYTGLLLRWVGSSCLVGRNQFRIDMIIGNLWLFP